MGERSYQEGTTVSEQGITVHQLVTEDEFGVPAVVMKIVSNRRDSVMLKLMVPGLKVERIGFHPDFENDNWSIEGEKLVFEREVSPEEELMTLYAVEGEDVVVLEEAIDSLEIKDIQPVQGSVAGTGAPTGDPLAAGTAEQNSESSEDGGTPDELLDMGEDPTETLVEPSDELADKTTVLEGNQETADSESEPAGEQPEERLIDLDEDETATGNGTDGTPTDAVDPGGSTDADTAETATAGDGSGDVVTAGESGENTGETAASGGSGDGVASAESGADGGGETDDAVEFESVSEEPPHAADEVSDDGSTPPDGSSAGSGGPNDDSGLEPTELSTRELIEELTQRLAEEDLSTGEWRRLEDAGLVDKDDRSDVHEAQISNLQSRVSDVETFTDSIENLLEAHGQPADVFEDFESRLARLEREFDDVKAEVESTAEAVDGVGPKLESVEEQMASVSDDMTQVRNSVATVEENQDSVRADLDELKSWREKVTGAMEAFMGD